MNEITEAKGELFPLKAPMINIAIEADAVKVMMPDNNLGIFKYLLRIPVTKPHKNPLPIDAKVAIQGLTPLMIKTPLTAAPIRKLPSAVKSAKSNKR